jgi:biotin operon repressor
MTPERTQNRYLIAKVILDLLHAVHGGGLRRSGEPVKIVDVDRVLISAVVLIGEHEGRLRTVADIERQLGLSRATVQRKLAMLREIGVIERHGRHYRINKTPRPSDAFVDDAMKVIHSAVK